jgi:hypothetical protein
METAALTAAVAMAAADAAPVLARRSLKDVVFFVPSPLIPSPFILSVSSRVDDLIAKVCDDVLMGGATVNAALLPHSKANVKRNLVMMVETV